MTNNIAQALGNGAATPTEGAEKVIGYCGFYSYSVLVSALAFLAAGLVFVIVAAVYEARKGLAEARRVEAEAAKAAAEAKKAQAEAAKAPGTEDDETRRDLAPRVVPVGAVTTFVKSFAAVLGDAKAWVAMVIIGLLLLWMAGDAPGLCKSGIQFDAGSGNEAAETNEADSDGNGADAAGNSSGNTAANASGNASDVGNVGVSRS